MIPLDTVLSSVATPVSFLLNQAMVLLAALLMATLALVWVVVNLHRYALGVLTLEHNVAFCYTFMYLFPYVHKKTDGRMDGWMDGSVRCDAVRGSRDVDGVKWIRTYTLHTMLLSTYPLSPSRRNTLSNVALYPVQSVHTSVRTPACPSRHNQDASTPTVYRLTNRVGTWYLSSYRGCHRGLQSVCGTRF